MTAAVHSDTDEWVRIPLSAMRGLMQRVTDLEAEVKSLKADTPQARQLQYEADVAGADAREYDRHGRDCQCPYCYYDPAEDGPGSAS